jgi:Tol biopolymer transport system component
MIDRSTTKGGDTMRTFGLSVFAAVACLAALLATPASGSSRSAQNGLIAFQSFVASPTGNVSQLFTVNPSGTGLKQITTIPAAAGDQTDPGAQDPAWSPDASKIVFDSDYHAVHGHPVNFFTVNADGSALSKLKLQVGGPLGPAAFSPDGRRLAFGGNNHLYVAQLATGTVRQLDHPSFNESSPTWSPNGKWIAFHRVKTGTKHVAAIFLIRPNGTGLRRLTAWKLDAGHPSWSPNGRRIAFSTYNDYDFFHKSANVYTIRPNGTRLQELTHLTGGNSTASSPAWSPDGARIVYQGPLAAIWIMNANGSQPHQLTHLQYNASNPAWATAP